MKKIILLSFFALISVFEIISDEFINKFNITGNRAKLVKVELIENKLSIIANYESTDLKLDFIEDNKCIINIQKNSLQTESICNINKTMLEGIYYFYLNKSISCFLVCYYPEGVTGLSANIMQALLIKINDKSIDFIQLSTFGSVYENFIDINDDDSFEFICIDLFYNENTDKKLFIANYFTLANQIQNISALNKLKVIDFYNGEEKNFVKIDYKLLSNPSVLGY